jgi:glycosyltransferase involved in cell wall biosynthesis
MKQHHVKKYNRSDNIHVVTNGWEPSEHSINTKTEKKDTSVLTFVGNISSHNLPFDFIKDINKCYKEINGGVKLHFVGHIPEKVKTTMLELDTNAIITFESFLPRNEANARMQSCSALLLFNPPDLARYLPGKVFDYLSAGRPIIVHGNEGETSKLVGKLSAGYFVGTGDELALIKTLNQLSLLSNNECVANTASLQLYSRKNLANQFYNLLNEIIK